MHYKKVYSIIFYLDDGSTSTWVCDKKPEIPSSPEGETIFYNHHKKYLLNNDVSYSIFREAGNSFHEIYNHKKEV